jgi:hypothetical protein
MIAARSGLEANDDPSDSTIAFNRSLGLAVDNKVFKAPSGRVDLTGNVVSAGPQTIAGLNVKVQYQLIGSTKTVRAVYTFGNPTASAITVKVSTNIGGFGGGANVKSTSSGDDEVTTADRWFETAGSLAQGDNLDAPSILFVADGRFADYGRSEEPATFSSISKIAKDGGVDFVATYRVTVMPGDTLGIMVFTQANTNASSIPAVDAVFANLATLESADLLKDLPIAQDKILNWYGLRWPDGPRSPYHPIRQLP